MLLRFGVSNFRSLWGYQEVSLMGTKLKDENGYLIRPEGTKYAVLPRLALYGANASGKSNVISAIKFMRDFVLDSHVRGRPESSLHRPFFQLNQKAKEESTKFDCDILMGSVRYHYGFEYDNKFVLAEWLYAYPTPRRQTLFVRRHGHETYFGPEVERSKARQIEGLTRPNSLFLSSAAQNNLQIAARVFSWFASSLVFVDEYYLDRRAHLLVSDAETRDFVVDFIRTADPSICGAEVGKQKISPSAAEFHKEFKALFRKHFTEKIIRPSELQEDDEEEDEIHQVRLKHRSAEGEVAFPFEEESTGTRRLLTLLGPMLAALKEGRTLVIDEIDNSLHTLLAAELLRLFASPNQNRSGAQIMFATHDTNLLSANLLRRDEIWFAEKARDGATHVYSLAELSIRKADNVERGYLQGRFGAIPFLSGFDRLLGGRQRSTEGAA